MVLTRLRRTRPLIAAALLACLTAGCDGAAAAPPASIRVLPSLSADAGLQPYFPEIAKTHVGLSFNFDPGTGVTDPELLFSPTPEARWLLSYLGENPPAAGGEPLHLNIPMSRRVPLRNNLLSVELWLAHVENLYVDDYTAAGRPGGILRFSPWVEQFGPPAWKLGFAPIEPLNQPRLALRDGAFLATGTTLDLALHSPPGSLAFFGLVNEAGGLVGLTRDGRLYLDAVRRLSTPYGMLDGLQQAAVPADAAGVTAAADGRISGLAGADQKTPFSFGPVRIYILPEAVADSLTEIQGRYSLPAQPMPPPADPGDISSLLEVGRREQPAWSPAWFYRNLRSIAETRALVHTALQRLDDALILDQTPWRSRDGRIALLQRRKLTGGTSKKYVSPGGAWPDPLFGIDTLDDADPTTPIVICEGALDALALRQLTRARGLARVVLAIAGVSRWRPRWASLARGREAIVATDTDEQGEKVAREIMLDCQAAGAASVRRLCAPDGLDWVGVLGRGRGLGAA